MDSLQAKKHKSIFSKCKYVIAIVLKWRNPMEPNLAQHTVATKNEHRSVYQLTWYIPYFTLEVPLFIHGYTATAK